MSSEPANNTDWLTSEQERQQPKAKPHEREPEQRRAHTIEDKTSIAIAVKKNKTTPPKGKQEAKKWEPKRRKADNAPWNTQPTEAAPNQKIIRQQKEGPVNEKQPISIKGNPEPTSKQSKQAVSQKQPKNTQTPSRASRQTQRRTTPRRQMNQHAANKQRDAQAKQQANPTIQNIAHSGTYPPQTKPTNHRRQNESHQENKQEIKGRTNPEIENQAQPSARQTKQNAANDQSMIPEKNISAPTHQIRTNPRACEKINKQTPKKGITTTKKPPRKHLPTQTRDRTPGNPQTTNQKHPKTKDIKQPPKQKYQHPTKNRQSHRAKKKPNQFKNHHSLQKPPHEKNQAKINQNRLQGSSIKTKQEKKDEKSDRKQSQLRRTRMKNYAKEPTPDPTRYQNQIQPEPRKPNRTPQKPQPSSEAKSGTCGTHQKATETATRPKRSKEIAESWSTTKTRHPTTRVINLKHKRKNRNHGEGTPRKKRHYDAKGGDTKQALNKIYYADQTERNHHKQETGYPVINDNKPPTPEKYQKETSQTTQKRQPHIATKNGEPKHRCQPQKEQKKPPARQQTWAHCQPDKKL
ncbi:hypothetical protein M408DRAFT_8070 [Serendipita vermifera MAFF 305830]|uniref:Uncharacterized protein n=1 Tax=Serendipita vermifera MAFF 305830 TaxID=933852 RepID=A0A0C2XLH3_SERVB|nr:hypothetical protein M408DRAFT_8070 [Serendipita vermifera MAFF 305830]